MSAEDERWHVRTAADEVKVLTLEQIDDLFRLDMIDGDTLLRQEGTTEWLPLRVVAGLNEDQPASAAPPAHSAPPPPPPPLPAPSERAPFVHSPSFAPPSVVARAPSLAPRSPSLAATSPGLAPPNPPALSVAPPAPSFAPSALSVTAPPLSAAPPALSFTPPEVSLPVRANRAETWLISLAAALGLLLTLQRNGLVEALLASAGQAATYARLEASLGGPGSGTLRAVDLLVAKPPSVSSAPTAR